MSNIPQADGRSKTTQAAANRFDWEPFQTAETRQVAVSYARLAAEMIGRHKDSVHLTKALKALIDARDAMVAATEADRALIAAGRK